MKTVEEISLLIFRIYIVMSVILTPATVKLKIFYIYKLNSPGVFCEKCLIFPFSLPLFGGPGFSFSEWVLDSKSRSGLDTEQH